MHFMILAIDKPESLALRLATRPAHVAYVDANIDRILVCGAKLSDDGETPVGSLLVIEASDRADAEAFAAADPYAEAGLFGAVTVAPWRKLVPKG
jgi:uncharacterized protein YciI